MSDMTRVRMLVGVEHAQALEVPDDVSPLVAGCMDAGTWEVMDADETDAIFAGWKRSYDPSGNDYDWREIWVELRTDVLRHILVAPTVRGLVQGITAPTAEDS